MKKITYYFALLLVGLFFVSSCDDEPLEGEFFSTPDGSDPADFCADAPLAITSAQVALANAAPAQQAELCDALIATINSTINVCGDDTGIFQSLLDELGTDCMIDTTDPGDGNDDLVGRTYLLTAFEVETPIDLNGDGVATTELISEGSCYENETLFFNDETNVTVTSTSFLEITVEVDADDNLIQSSECIFEEDITNATYSVNGNTITIDGIDGVINGNQIVITVPEGFFGEIVGDDGISTVELLEDIVFTYTLQ